MSWSGLDTAVVAVLALQGLAGGGVAFALIRLRDSVKRSARRAGTVVRAGAAVVETGQAVAPTIAARATALATTPIRRGSNGLGIR